MNIAIIVIPELGGTIRAFLLAKSLLQRGHQISYYGITDFKQDVHRQGLNFVTLFENEYSDGEVDDDPIHEGFFAGLRFLKRKLNRPERKKLLESLIAGGFVPLFAREIST
jgi:UDP:flavonoid glycosyltransferase YjiC (YdhE family)